MQGCLAKKGFLLLFFRAEAANSVCGKVHWNGAVESERAVGRGK